jgi:tetratricopeptide (TPR) repeat protein
MPCDKSLKLVSRNPACHSGLILAGIQCLLVATWLSWGCGPTMHPADPLKTVRKWVCDPQADELLKAGDMDASIELHLAFLKNNPSNGLALYHLGYAYGRKGEFNLEIEYYEKAINAGYQPDGLFFNLGMAYAELQDTEKAIDALKRGLAINPQYSDHYFGLGLLYQKSRDLSQAGTFFLKAIELNPENLEARFFLGKVYEAQGERIKAIEQIRKIIEIDPGYPEAREYLKQLEGS